MITFEVNDMTCGHCASTISKAVASVDEGADIRVDLNAHRVQIEPKTATGQQLSDAIRDAGYNPTVIEDASSISSATKRSGCCCGYKVVATLSSPGSKTTTDRFTVR